jgi:hypothetical protein
MNRARPILALIAAVALPTMASGATYSCASTHAYGWGGQLLDQWAAGAEQDGQVRFTFNAATGDYLEQMVGSAAAITGSATLAILGKVEPGSDRIVAADTSASLVLKIFDSVHGVYYARLDGDAPVEIGACEKTP